MTWSAAELPLSKASHVCLLHLRTGAPADTTTVYETTDSALAALLLLSVDLVLAARYRPCAQGLHCNSDSELPGTVCPLLQHLKKA